MTTFVYGVAGSGKSFYVEKEIISDLAAGRRVYLIVPEQQAYLAERHYCEILPPESQLSFEIVNFTRLANIAERQYGGLSYNYVDPATKALIMWQNICELSPMLEEYSDAASSEAHNSKLTDMMLSAVSEMQKAALSPQKLEHAASRLEHESSLSKRLRDLALIWASYANGIGQTFDDSSDSLTHLASLLSENDLLSDRCVYIDSFMSYTEQEYLVIEQIMRQAQKLTITVGCDCPGSNRMHFASVSASADRLRKLAAGRGGYNEEELEAPRRFASESFSDLEKYLWQTDALPDRKTAPAPDCIRIINAKTPYTEAEAAANVICDALRDGMRYRDISVIMRDATTYRGIIDAAFDRFSIPYFMSGASELSSQPLIKLILSALAIKNRSWYRNDVISLIKTGLCGISERECDIFEDYCNTWNITGKRFTDGEWTMNPDGYVDSISERGLEILRVANDVRKKLVDPLLSLFAELDAAVNPTEVCRALYNYTEMLGVRASLDALAARERQAGDLRGASDTLRVYRLYIDVLDKIAAVFGDSELDSMTFAQAMQIMFSHTEFGSMPTRNDEVTIGSASLLRAGEPRLVIVMGLCDGEFPADIKDDGIFSFADRVSLKSLGLPIASDAGLRSADELFYAYRALCAPSERLVLTYHDTSSDGTRRQPSRIIERVTRIFPGIKTVKYDEMPPIDRIQTKESAIDLFPALDDTEAGILRDMLGENEAMRDRLKSLDIPLSDTDCRVSPDTAEKIFGKGNISVSQSRLESFTRCPFQYYCNYVLGLRESRRAEFSANNVGNFIHYVMECFMRKTASDAGGFDPYLDDEKVNSLADEIIAEYSERLISSDDERARRMTFLISRLRRIALILIYNIMEEFRHSLFLPTFFELSVDGSDPSFPEPARLNTPDGTGISLHGIVDRIDLYKNGNDVYIRVIDYKTGKKEYSPSDISDGLGLQLLLYLFALCRSSSDTFRRTIGCPPEGRIYPAGALYLSADIPFINVDESISPEEIRQLASDSIKRSGPIINDEQIRRAMNDGLDRKFLGTSKKNPGLSNEEFDLLCSEIEEVIGRIGSSMHSGNASALPMRKDGSSPCDLCSYSGICRSAKHSKNHIMTGG